MRKQSKMKNMALRKYRIHRVWVVVEYQHATRDSRIRKDLSKAWKTRKKKVRKIFAKLVSIINTHEFTAISAAILTGMYAVWSIDQAFVQRGYRAYGGEWFAIPFVFIGLYKILGWFAEVLYIKLHNGEIYGQ